MTDNSIHMKMMSDLATAFELRYRDVKKSSHCNSAEWRYVPENLIAEPQKERVQAPFSEDCFFLALRAWGKVSATEKQAVRLAFGFGARNQHDREQQLQQAANIWGWATFDSLIAQGLVAWLKEIQAECGEDFDLLFYQ
ncbi:hypothetical protein [Kingella kingae]|uniref:hypothetical protein n=1 Tax=Kingella kingae TaxID=504 RepID=UPI00254A973C|nr:hypothetical protein [Kingella kingae]MDK4586951.1 hypothetical protein [Kingella kingae]MDK4630771.1 hypothetical protein [Kingella kingae]MDK4644448.1 hypothetical protein [Kingella kingae]MDK4670476.1 hypothetical protein [Kingella kingae]